MTHATFLPLIDTIGREAALALAREHYESERALIRELCEMNPRRADRRWPWIVLGLFGVAVWAWSAWLAWPTWKEWVGW